MGTAVRSVEPARRQAERALARAHPSHPAGAHGLLALQRQAGNAAVNALLAGRLRTSDSDAVGRLDAALREIRRDEPGLETVEKGLLEVRAVGVPIDLEGAKPPPAALAVTTTGFGPGSVAPKRAVPPAKPVPKVNPLGRAAARRTPAVRAAATKRGAVGGTAAGPVAAPPRALSPDQLRQPPVAPPGVRPEQDAAFAGVRTGLVGAGTQARAHPPAAAKAKEAQDAALAPTGDLGGQARAAKIDTMDAQQAGSFDKKAFISAVKAAIEAKSPKTLKEADDYKESGRAGEVKDEVKGLVTRGAEGQAKDIKTATETPPDESKAVPKPVTPMAPEPAAAVPAVPASGAAPKPAPPEQTNLQAGKIEADREMAGAGVTESQLQQSGEPDFQQAVSDKKAAAQHADTAPGEFRKQEQQLVQQNQTEAAAGATAAITGMRGAKSTTIAGLISDKTKAKSADEAKRAEVTTRVQGIYAAAESDVKAILDGIDPKVEAEFGQGEAGARAEFEAYVSAKMAAYKKDRYGGWLGPIRWARDNLVGMPDKVNEFYAAGREIYLKRMDGVIERVANIVGGDLERAKRRIAAGRTQIAAYVQSLPQDLQKVGGQAAQDIGEKFEALEGEVAAKQEAAVDLLASKYVESRRGLDERIEALQAENKGLVDKAIGAIKAVINTIRELAAMLAGVLARAAGVVGDIIKNPIGFLGHLIDGVKGGILKFKDNIVGHLRQGLMGWLFGALAEGGIELPETFDAKGIIQLLGSIFGLTWARIRARIAKKIGEPAMNAIETGVEIFQKLRAAGVAGLWQMLLDKLGDIKEMILEQVKDFVVTKIIVAGITWLIGLLNPAAAFIKACKLIYDVVMFFVNNAERIKAFVDTVLDSVADVVRGNVGVVVEKINNVLGQMVPILIGFLASAIGLGGIGQKIREIIENLQKPVTKAIDWVIDKGLKLAGPVLRGLKKVGGFVKGKVAAGKAWVKGKAEAGKKWVKGRANAVKERFTAAKDNRQSDDQILKAALTDVRTQAASAQNGLSPTDLKGIRDRHALKALSQQPTVSGVIVTAQLMSQSVTLPPETVGLGHARDASGVLPGRTGSYASLSGKQDVRKAQNPCLSVYAEHVLPRNFVDSFLKAMKFGGMASGGYEYNRATTVLMYQGAKTLKDAADTHWAHALTVARSASAALRNSASSKEQRAAAHQDLWQAIERRAHASAIEARKAAEAENAANARLRRTTDPADASMLPTAAQVNQASIDQVGEVKVLLADQAARHEAGTLGVRTAVNINSDPPASLQELLGVGPTTAALIVSARPFTSKEDLKRVHGIGDKRLEWNMDRIVV